MELGGGIMGYIDPDYVGELDNRISLTGYAFQGNGCTVSWKATL